MDPDNRVLTHDEIVNFLALYGYELLNVLDSKRYHARRARDGEFFLTGAWTMYQWYQVIKRWEDA